MSLPVAERRDRAWPLLTEGPRKYDVSEKGQGSTGGILTACEMTSRAWRMFGEGRIQVFILFDSGFEMESWPCIYYIFAALLGKA